MNDELLNCFLKPDASVTECGSNLLLKLMFSEIDSRQCKIGSYDWLRSANAVCLSTQRVADSGLTFFLSNSVALSVIDYSSFR